ncbi:MAG: DNA-protecting protein DprA [Planctomycetes bacterium]|nr:DNA-protecting protein DprA [Planctomycetota bacterium]
MAHLPQHISNATLRLLLAPGIGPVTLRKLRERFGSDERAAEVTVTELADLHGIGRQTATSLRKAIDESRPDQEREAMQQAGVQLILHGDEDYPALLAAIPDPPAALWIKGEFKDEDRLAICIVGSRKCTTYGREQAGRFAALLAESGLTIISGGALGIDGAAHRGALQAGGRTVIVMGCGLAHSYPPEHESLFQKAIDGHGAMVSEYPMRTEPLARHFPRRNRIISGLSLGVLVVEAARRSGALITARVAAEDHGREVMALPGRVDSNASEGSLDLIQKGGAALVVDPSDVIELLESPARHSFHGTHESRYVGESQLFETVSQPAQPRREVGSLTDAQRTILNAIESPLTMDELSTTTGLAPQTLRAEITMLEIQKRVVREGSRIAARSSRRR